MNLKEHEGRALFIRYGMAVPDGFVSADSTAALEWARKNSADDHGRTYLLKAQVAGGKRGKSGGVVKTALDDFDKNFSELLKKDINGHHVDEILTAERIDINRELFLSITVDRFSRRPLMLFSESGGVDIEDVAKKNANMLVKTVFTEDSFPEKEFRESLERQITEGFNVNDLIDVAKKLYALFFGEDCILAEINPLIADTAGRLISADAKITIDDAAIFRHEEYIDISVREFSEQEKNAHEHGLSYVELDGDLAIIGNGAGLVMSTLDAAKQYGLNPANFCDVGGGASSLMVEEALKIVLSKKRLRGIFINIYGGITRCDEVAEGLVSYLKKTEIGIPIVVRMTGTNEKEGLELLNKNNVHAFDSFQKAVEEISARLAQ